MTVLSTTDDLKAVPVGEMVRVASQVYGDRTYQRTEDGFVYQGIPVPLGLFKGALAHGLVATGNPPPQVGQVWYALSYPDQRYRYLVVHVDPGRPRFTALGLRRQDVTGFHEYDFSSTDGWGLLTTSHEDDSWAPLLHAAIHWRNAEQQVRQMQDMQQSVLVRVALQHGVWTIEQR